MRCVITILPLPLAVTSRAPEIHVQPDGLIRMLAECKPYIDLLLNLESTDWRTISKVSLQSVQSGDPMFDQEAIKKKIFRFEPGSPAVKLGIKPLDLSLVGSAVQDLQ
jgi:hypothetical protein